MEISNEADITQGADVMTGMPVIETEEELNAFLGKSEKKEEPVKKAEAEPGSGNDEGEEEPVAEGQGTEEEPVEYPTLLHYLNERHNLALNLDEVKELSKEQEAEALDSLIERMTTGVNSALEEYQYIESLLQDAEIQEVLRAKSEGKTLRDLYANFSSSAEGMNDDTLALQDFKKRFPKSSDEAIQSMVESLKKNGQFEPFIQGIREQHAEEQSLAQRNAEEQTKAEAEQNTIREREQIQQYANYLGGVNSVYGVPLTQEMKEAVFNMTTARDNNGLTQLDHALQSDEGTVLAALGIAYMKQIIQNGASIQKNKARGRVMDKIFDSPEKLQSGGGRTNQEDPYNADVLNRF